MARKIFVAVACMVFGLMIATNDAWGGSVSTSVYAEAGAITTCTDSSSTNAFCSVGFADAFASAKYFAHDHEWELSLGADATSSQSFGGQSYGLASGSIDDLLTFTDSSLTGPAFAEFTFGIQFSNNCIYSSADATAGNQTVPLASLSYGGSGVATFTTTAQPITFGSPFDFGMSGDISCGSSGQILVDMVLEDVLVMNANGNPISGVSLTSGSGTVYPLDSRNIVPEPPSLLLLGAGALGILAAIRFRID
ncbi:MAG TPA: PEP-CTERM sorting domain-containing protein [Candidatus Acidoferrales bacterium]|nr:PEP-CTERM sorting domain-containing protein [Candidatus Acidoferrales bacterium]